MRLDQLVHWRLEGTPDVFTEQRDGWEWLVIHSGGATHHAGFLQRVEFDRPVCYLSVTAFATLYTTGGGLMMRVGIDPTGGTDPQASAIQWSGWDGSDNGWDGELPKVIDATIQPLPPVVQATAFLESKCRWPVKANTARWFDPHLVLDYVEEPNPEPNPEPQPEPEPSPSPLPSMQVLQEATALANRLLEQAAVILSEVGRVLELFDEEPHTK